MSFRSFVTTIAFSTALSTTLLFTGAASADDAPPPPPANAPPPAAAPAPPPAAAPAPTAPAPKKDGARFRGGIALEGGGFLVPDVINLGMAGLQGQLGVQINNDFGVYAVPSFGIVFGDMGGIHVGAAVLFDYTFLDNLLTVGAGPDVAGFAAFGVNTSELGIAAAGGSLYGARLHFAVHPAVGIGDNGIRRKAFTIGVDVRLYGGGAGLAKSGVNGASAKVAEFIATPTLSIGYTAF